MHRKPDVGFDPGSPGSRPGPKAGAKPLRHPGIPCPLFFWSKFVFIIQDSSQRSPFLIFFLLTFRVRYISPVLLWTFRKLVGERFVDTQKTIFLGEWSIKFHHVFQEGRSSGADWKKLFWFLFYFFKDFIYLFMRDTERGRDTGRGRSRPHAGNPMWDLIPVPQDQALGQRQALNRWATQVSHILNFLIKTANCFLYLVFSISVKNTIGI